MKLYIDFLLSLILILLLIPLFIIIALIIIIADGYPIFYYSKRIGINNNIFMMPKFRTMKKNTPQLATHLIENPDQFIIPYLKILRKYSIDEIPQLFSVIIGKMSLVGPRPALYNQYDLINLRNLKNIYKVKPGITGYAQINGRDSLSIEDKVELDYYYYKNQSFFLDLKILIKTFFIIFIHKDVRH